MNDNCRTCLRYFNENNGKYALDNCPAIMSRSSRFQLIKNIMKTCSITLFSSEREDKISQIFICTSCVDEIDAMLSFLEKCIQSEAILKQAAAVKTENSSVWLERNILDDRENLFQPQVEVKVEEVNNEASCENSEFSEFASEDISLRSPQEISKNNNDQFRHECCECHKMFQSALSLAFHKYKHVESKSLTCVICKNTFPSFQLVKKHMAEEHKAHYQPYVCRQCPKVFAIKQHLTRHKHTRHNAKMYCCSACKRTFSTVSSLEFHKNIHSELSPYACEQCTKSFSSSSLLRYHKKKVHSEIKKFECYCGKSFNREKKLQLHINSVHEKKEKLRKYSCTECDKKFQHPYALKNHINTHLGIKPFLCNACGSAFTALSNLTSHFRRVHSTEKQPPNKIHLCDNCGESFARASHLKRHNLRKHVPNAEKKHECPICNKKFLEKSDVMGHIKLHDDFKPFVCDQCSKCFRTAWRLQAHVKRVHLGLRPFECPTCSLKFKTKSHLEKHIRTHTGEKPFPCPHCDYTCAEKSNLKKHINIHIKTM